MQFSRLQMSTELRPSAPKKPLKCQPLVALAGAENAPPRPRRSSHRYYRLGYVGLPLAVYLARHFPVVGFDIDASRVDELASGIDRTREVTEEEFAAAKQLSYSADITDLRACNFFIVTVPTPVDQAKRPDLSALIAASRTGGLGA